MKHPITNENIPIRAGRRVKFFDSPVLYVVVTHDGVPFGDRRYYAVCETGDYLDLEEPLVIKKIMAVYEEPELINSLVPCIAGRMIWNYNPPKKMTHEEIAEKLGHDFQLVDY